MERKKFLFLIAESLKFPCEFEVYKMFKDSKHFNTHKNNLRNRNLKVIGDILYFILDDDNKIKIIDKVVKLTESFVVCFDSNVYFTYFFDFSTFKYFLTVNDFIIEKEFNFAINCCKNRTFKFDKTSKYFTQCEIFNSVELFKNFNILETKPEKVKIFSNYKTEGGSNIMLNKINKNYKCLIVTNKDSFLILNGLILKFILELEFDKILNFNFESLEIFFKERENIKEYKIVDFLTLNQLKALLYIYEGGEYKNILEEICFLDFGFVFSFLGIKNMKIEELFVFSEFVKILRKSDGESNVVKYKKEIEEVLLTYFNTDSVFLKSDLLLIKSFIDSSENKEIKLLHDEKIKNFPDEFGDEIEKLMFINSKS